jgi:hypothetical protein
MLFFLLLAAGNSSHATGNLPVTDTLPPAARHTDPTAIKKDDELIKEVPRAKKQEKPIAITSITAKPILVKPKIIVKPIIRIH